MNDFAGTATLVRLALRRDRVILPVWILVFVSMAAGSAKASIDLYPDVASRVSAADTTNSSPALVSLYGRIFDPTSLGEVSLFKLTSFGALLVGLLAALLVVRHTRAEEESGRLELLSAGVLGRYAALSAALILSTGTVIVLGLLTAVGLAGSGLPTGGSFAFGLTWIVAGLASAGVGALTAQLTEGARTANGFTAAVLGVSYVLRALGDSASESGPRRISWLSPIGWAQQIRPYAGDRWLVALGPLALLVVLVAAAFALLAAAMSVPAWSGRGQVPRLLHLRCVHRWHWRGGCIALRSSRGGPRSCCSDSWWATSRRTWTVSSAATAPRNWWRSSVA